MSYRSISNPFGYAIQDGGGGTLPLDVKAIVGGAYTSGTMSNKASIPLTIPPVYPLDDVETNINSKSSVHGSFDHSSNTFIYDPTTPKNDEGFPGQHAGGRYGTCWWISKIPGGAPFLPGKNYFTRQANTVYYNKIMLIQDDLWATDSYTGMNNNQKFNGNSVQGSRRMILGQTSGDQSEVRFLNVVLIRNDSTTFSDYNPSTPRVIGGTLNSLPGTDTFQTYIPPASEAYWASSRWQLRTTYPRSTDGTYSKIK